MLASHRHRFIFTKTNKTAGTSVEIFFQPFCTPTDAPPPTHVADESVTPDGVVGFRGRLSRRPPACRFWSHMPAWRVRELLGEERWNAYLKFTTIRNPYDKVVSQYYFERYLEAGPGNRVRFDELRVERERFEAWVERADLAADRDRYVIDGRFCLDDVIRYENLENDLRKVCTRLGLPAELDSLGTFKKGSRPDEATVSAVYTTRARAAVTRALAFELERFGYAFPGEAA